MKVELVLPDAKEVSETERKEYVAAISAVFPRIERDVHRKMYECLVEAYTNFRAAEEQRDKVVFMSGQLEGMALLLEQWRNAHMEHSAKITDS